MKSRIRSTSISVFSVLKFIHDLLDSFSFLLEIKNIQAIHLPTQKSDLPFFFHLPIYFVI